jgi:hypothetical protein
MVCHPVLTRGPNYHAVNRCIVRASDALRQEFCRNMMAGREVVEQVGQCSTRKRNFEKGCQVAVMVQNP